MDKHIQSSEKNGMLHWNINRPERFNALGTTIGDELENLLTDLREKLALQVSSVQDIRSLVITATPRTSADKKIWVAGGDLKELSLLKDQSQGRSYSEKLSTICSHLENLPIPVVMGIDGSAIGGGVEFALASDIRLATNGSDFHFKQLEVGLATGYGGARRLVNLIGKSKATYWLLSRQKLDQTTLLDSGLIHEVVADKEDMWRRIEELHNGFLPLHSAAVGIQKKMLSEACTLDWEKGQQAELDNFSSLWMNPTHKKILDRFTSKPANE